MSLPVEVSPNALDGVPAGGQVRTATGFIDTGVVYPSNDGSRLLTHSVMDNAYFVQIEDNTNQPWKIGKVYQQRAYAFGLDTWGGATTASLKTRLAGTTTVISNFLDIYMGCLSVAGGPVAWSITGMNVVVAGGKIKQNYDLYRQALEAFVSDDMELRRLMPFFYDIMFVELYLGRIESDLTGKTKEVVTEMVTKKIVKSEAAKKILNKTIGVFVGKIGEDAMKTTLTGISKVIRDVLLKVIDHIALGKPLSDEQVEQLAKHHFVPMYAAMSRVPLLMAEQKEMGRAKEVIREAARNATAVRPRLLKIAKAIDALTA